MRSPPPLTAALQLLRGRRGQWGKAPSVRLPVRPSVRPSLPPFPPPSLRPPRSPAPAQRGAPAGAQRRGAVRRSRCCGGDGEGEEGIRWDERDGTGRGGVCGMGMCGHRPPGGPQEPPRGEVMGMGRGAVQVGAHPRTCPLGPVVWTNRCCVSVGQGDARLARAAATGVFWMDLGGPEGGAQGK